MDSLAVRGQQHYSGTAEPRSYRSIRRAKNRRLRWFPRWTVQEGQALVLVERAQAAYVRAGGQFLLPEWATGSGAKLHLHWRFSPDVSDQFQEQVRRHVDAGLENQGARRCHRRTGGRCQPTGFLARTQSQMYYVLQGRWTGTLTSRLRVQAGATLTKLD